MSEDADKRFEEALRAVRSRDFDEVKKAMEALGFKFKEGKDPQHWTYIHPDLKDDPLFRYPRNLYKPHGSRRSADLTRHDQSQARQVILALEATLRASDRGGDET